MSTILDPAPKPGDILVVYRIWDGQPERLDTAPVASVGITGEIRLGGRWDTNKFAPDGRETVRGTVLPYYVRWPTADEGR